jgi:NADH-quinone oxidoreductase subunit L
MEGPTPSSAIFYGSLSVHIGVFLLLRTYPIWHETAYFPWMVGAIGMITALGGFFFSRSQTNIKGQIGYATLAQVGLMLVELSLGFRSLALVHFFGNACLRCFQLLISPSILIQQIQNQKGSFDLPLAIMPTQSSPASQPIRNGIKSSLYVFSINEGYLEEFFKRNLIIPFYHFAVFCNDLHHRLEGLFFRDRLTGRRSHQYQLLLPAYLGFGILLTGFSWLAAASTVSAHPIGESVLISMAIFYSLASLGERGSGRRTLNLILTSNLSVVLAIALLGPGSPQDYILYVFGVLVSWLLAISALSHIMNHCEVFSVTSFSGILGQFPLAGITFLIGIAGILGFPCSVTFIGEDLILHHALARSAAAAAILVILFILNGITLIRMYSYIFLGRQEAKVEGVDFDYSPLRTVACLFIFFLGNIGALLIKK